MKSKKIPQILWVPAVCFLLFAVFVFFNVFGSRVTLPKGDGSVERTRASAEELKLELNEASVEELITVPGIGQVLAQRIVDYRLAYGPFGGVDELTAVSGIGEELLKSLRDYIYVEDAL